MLQQINPVTYKLLLPSRLTIHSTFHGLKCLNPGPLDEGETHNQPPEPRIIDNHPAYTIHHFLEK